MKKFFLAAALAAVLAQGASAAEPTTLTDRADKLDTVVYGNVQRGSFLDRIGNLDTMIYGKSYNDQSLDDRVSDLYRDVVRGASTDQASLSTRVNTLEYYLTDEIKQKGLSDRTEILENTVWGKKKTGSLQFRVGEIEKAIYGDTHFELVPVTLPANTVFKISLNGDVSSKMNQVGDVIYFTVEEDVKADDILVLPRGSQGSGVVTKVSRPKMFGRSGSLEISFNQVFSIDDEEIPTVLGPESKEKLKMEAAAVGASVIGALALGPIGLVGGFFVKGKDVEIAAGSTLYIQTREDVTTRGMQRKEGAPSYELTHPTEDDNSVSTTADGVKVQITSASDVEKSAKVTEETAKETTEEKKTIPEVQKATERVKAEEAARAAVLAKTSETTKANESVSVEIKKDGE